MMYSLAHNYLNWTPKSLIVPFTYTTCERHGRARRRDRARVQGVWRKELPVDAVATKSSQVAVHLQIARNTTKHTSLIFFVQPLNFLVLTFEILISWQHTNNNRTRSLHRRCSAAQSRDREKLLRNLSKSFETTGLQDPKAQLLNQYELLRNI